MKIKKNLLFYSIFFLCLQLISVKDAISDPINENVIARVNGKAILKEDIDFFAKQDQDTMQSRGKVATTEDSVKIRAFWIDQLIKEELVLQEAEKKNISATEQEVEKGLSLYKTPDSDFSSERLKKIVKNALIVEKVIKTEVLEKIRVSEDEIKKYYEEKRDEFIKPDGDVISFEEVKEFIEKSLQGAVIFKETEKWIKVLKEKATIEIFD